MCTKGEMSICVVDKRGVPNLALQINRSIKRGSGQEYRTATPDIIAVVLKNH